MMRPMMDVNGSEYRAILRGREMYRRYGRDYKDVIWAEDVLERLERKSPFENYTDKDHADFLKVKEIYERIFSKSGSTHEETAENHTTPYYIWRTKKRR